jgi:hypothetical protein
MDLGCITQFLSNIKDISRRSISSVEETGVQEVLDQCPDTYSYWHYWSSVYYWYDIHS